MKMRNQITGLSPRINRRARAWSENGLRKTWPSNGLIKTERTQPTRRSPGEEILVPVNFTDGCEYAVDVAVEMARTLNCGVLLAHVADRVYGHTFLDSEQRELLQLRSVEAATEKLARLADEKRNGNVAIRCVVKPGLPSLEILRLAETEKARMIVMGRTPRNPISRMLTGSVSREIADCSSIPVLIVNNFGNGKSR